MSLFSVLWSGPDMGGFGGKQGTSGAKLSLQALLKFSSSSQVSPVMGHPWPRGPGSVFLFLAVRLC